MKLPILLCALFIFNLNTECTSQKIISSIGNQKKCTIDSTTKQIFLKSDDLGNGFTFVINGSGKICSSGKVASVKDYARMKGELNDLYANKKISQPDYTWINCDLKKGEEIRNYTDSQKGQLDHTKVMAILERKCE